MADPQNFEFRDTRKSIIEPVTYYIIFKIVSSLFLLLWIWSYHENRDLIVLFTAIFIALLLLFIFSVVNFCMFSNVIFPPSLIIDSEGIRIGTTRTWSSIRWCDVRKVTLQRNYWFARFLNRFFDAKWVLNFELGREVSSFQVPSKFNLPFFDFMFGTNKRVRHNLFVLVDSQLNGVDPDELLAFAKMKIAEARQTRET